MKNRLKPHQHDAFVYIPPEILFFNILARLPVKSLLRFRCVCKAWLDTIESPDFETTHLNLYQDNWNHSRLLGMENRYSDEECWMPFRYPDKDKDPRWVITHAQDNTLEEVMEVPPITRTFIVEASLNALVIIGRELLTRDGPLFLWNPSIRKHLKIPPGHYHDHHHHFSVPNAKIGLGYDPVNNDYKVLAIMRWGPLGELYPPGPTMVYSVQKGYWRRLSCVHDPTLRISSGLKYCKGNIYWVARPNTGDSREERSSAVDHGAAAWKWNFVYFDVSKEVIYYMALPPTKSKDYPRSTEPYVLKESIAVIDMYSKYAWIWLMENNNQDIGRAWVKICSVDLRNFNSFHFRFLRRNGQLMLGKKGSKIESYDVNTRQKGTIVSKRPWRATDQVIDYVESLVLLKQTSKVAGRAMTSKWQARRGVTV